MGTALFLRRAAVAACAAALLGACASPAGILPGEPAQTVIARLGTPTLTFPRPEGGERLIWSGQPMGQFTWISDIGPDGKTLHTFQALTSTRFTQLGEGKWDAARLHYEFGPPADITRVGLRGEQIVWEYRFKEDDVWNSLMYVYVGRDGYVYRFHPGPDPMYERSNFLNF